MKPLTVDNADGRTLLALRAGQMTPSELSARNGSGPSRWLLKEGLIEQDDSYYRITAAGRAACPLRNPLAAPGVVPVATYKPEIDMSRENTITRQEVLSAIVAAGQGGTSLKELITKFGCREGVIYNHISLLNKQIPPVIFKPTSGVVCAIQYQQSGASPAAAAPKKAAFATRAAIFAWLTDRDAATVEEVAEGIGSSVENTEPVLRGMYAGLVVDRILGDAPDQYRYFVRQAAAPDQPAEPVTEAKTSEPDSTVNTKNEPKTETPAAQMAGAETLESLGLADLETINMPDDAFETIEVNGAPAPSPMMSMVIEENDFEAGVYSDGTMNLVIDDGLQDAQINFSPAALAKLRRFLGLFQEAA